MPRTVTDADVMRTFDDVVEAAKAIGLPADFWGLVPAHADERAPWHIRDFSEPFEAKPIPGLERSIGRTRQGVENRLRGIATGLRLAAQSE